MLKQHEELFIPQDERTLRRFQRKVNQLSQRVRGWAQSVIDSLPKGLAILEDEAYILSLYLAQQRRLNLEMDARNGEETLLTRLGRVLPFLSDGEDDWELVEAAHHLVASQLESDIEQACSFFCRDRNIPPISDPAIDWRVAIRYMAQELHRIASQIDIKAQNSASPLRFELTLVARNMAIEVAARRRDMLIIFCADREPV